MKEFLLFALKNVSVTKLYHLKGVIEWLWDNRNVNLYIRQAEFDTQIPEFDTLIRQESKLAPVSNI